MINKMRYDRMRCDMDDVQIGGSLTRSYNIYFVPKGMYGVPPFRIGPGSDPTRTYLYGKKDGGDARDNVFASKPIGSELVKQVEDLAEISPVSVCSFLGQDVKEVMKTTDIPLRSDELEYLTKTCGQGLIIEEATRK